LIISFIVAMDRNRVIGRNNRIPWRLPADQAFFRKTTMGHPILMGRKTYLSIGRPLPGRTNIVMTRNPEYRAPGCEVVHSVREALERYGTGEGELFVIGGTDIFKLFLPVADRLYITLIRHEFPGDTYFPEIDPAAWKLVSEKPGIRDEKNPYDYVFQIYERA